LFEKLKETQPEAFKKIQPIEGDASELNLGISDESLEKLKSCSVIFHAAASVRFDDPLRSAILINTRGAREVCEFARKVTNLKALIHVSTAFIQPKNFLVEEKIYPPEGNWCDYIKFAEHFDEDMLSSMSLK
jgi:alcohol-forming fatty acyl-CoA reductase